VKRRVALLFAAAVLLLVAASLLVARTAWVGDGTTSVEVTPTRLNPR